MTIADSPLRDSLADYVSSNTSAVESDRVVAVIKLAKSTAEQQGAALVEMIEQSGKITPSEKPSLLDLYA
ncbi:MAG: hypothetical protein AB1898_09730 [Acidobacteriota bacterium]